MNWLDFVFGLTLAASTASGVQRGLARIGIGLAALVVAFAFGCTFYGEAASLFAEYTSSRGVAEFVGFFAIFFGVLLVGSLLGAAATAMFKWMGLGWANRLLGGAFGLLRGALVCIVLLLAVNAFLPGQPPRAVVQSSLAPHLLDASETLSTITPQRMKDEFQINYNKARQVWTERVKNGLGKSE